MAKRDHLSEILEIQTRTGERPPFIDVLLRMREVKSLIENYDSPPDEALRYCPVGLVACIEAYFRAVIKQLIDSGPPFSDRAGKFERITFDFKVVSAIHVRTITLGDLVGHLIPLSQKKDINSAMSFLLDTDFFECIREVRDHYPWKPEKTASPEPLIANQASVFADLDRVFELRHIVCHEFAYPVQVSRSDAERFIESVETFLSASNFLVMKLLFKDLPDTQQERNIYFDEKYQTAEKNMQATLKSAEHAFNGKRLDEFLALQKAWENYRKQDAELVSSKFNGGTIRSQIHAQRLEYLTQRRIRDIEEMVENEKP